MNKTCIAMVFFALANAGCASERLYVNVVDDEGCPVTNAIVRVGFSTSHVVFGGGHGGSRSSGHAEGRTDNDGNAVVKFSCNTSDIGWGVEADGFYRSEIRREYFKGENVLIPPAFGYWKLSEHEKHGKIVLYRKKNPQPMYAYTRDIERKAPIANGRYGFDLEYFDWLPPYGNGKVADFYYVRDRKDIDNVNTAVLKNSTHKFMSYRKGTPNYPAEGDVVGRIEFEDKCGMYVKKWTENENFPSTYGADTNERDVSEWPICIVAQQGGIWVREGNVIEADEYIVIRSRVKCDERGNIISANYSKLLGPVGFGSIVAVKESVFNPRPNDTNLEFDPEQNLYKGKKGRGRIP